MTDTFKPGDRVEWDSRQYGPTAAAVVKLPYGVRRDYVAIVTLDDGSGYYVPQHAVRHVDEPHTPTQEEIEDVFRDVVFPTATAFTNESDQGSTRGDPEAELAGFWEQLEDESRDIFFSRHKKYGPRNIADAPGGALNGVVVRMHDKMARLRNFIEGDKTEYSDESIHDTLIDIGNYANIARLILKDQWPS